MATTATATDATAGTKARGPVDAESLEFNPEVRKQTNIELVQHLINVNSSPPGPVNGTSRKVEIGSETLIGSNPSQVSGTSSKLKRLKFTKRIKKDASISNNAESNNDRERDAKTLELLQKINVSLTQEVTMLREQRDQAVRAATTAADRLGKLMTGKEQSEEQDNKVEHDVVPENDREIIPKTDVDTNGNNNLNENDHLNSESDDEAREVTAIAVGASSQVCLLESEIKDLKDQLDKKEKTVAFFRLELLEEKDSSKKEKATLKNEVDHLKRQNVVNANRVVILEDEMRNMKEGRDEENTAEVIETLTRENEDLKKQMERSLDNMRKMSMSLQNKEENEEILKKDLQKARVNELDAKEELESCRKAQRKAISDNAKLCHQLESNTSLRANSKKNHAYQGVNDQMKNDRPTNVPNTSSNPLPQILMKNSDHTSVVESEGFSESTPKAVNTVASKYQQPDMKGESAFLSCLANINDTIDKETKARRCSKNPKSDSQSHVDASPKVSVSYRLPSFPVGSSESRSNPNFPPTQDLSIADLNPDPPVFFESCKEITNKNERKDKSVRISKTSQRYQHVVEDDEMSGGTAAFNDEIEGISVAYESITRRPKYSAQNRISLLQRDPNTKHLAPFRLPDLSRIGSRRYDHDDEDVLSVDLSLKERKPENVPHNSGNDINIAKQQQQQLSDVLSGMLTFLDTAVSEPSLYSAVPHKKPPLQTSQYKLDGKTSPNAQLVGTRDLKQRGISEPDIRIKVRNNNDDADVTTVNDLQSDVEKLQAKLEESRAMNVHLEQQNLFIKKNYNDTVELLQKEADDNKMLKEEASAKNHEQLIEAQESRVNIEIMLTKKIREYEATLEVFEHAVASQNEVMMELVKNLERLQIEEILEETVFQSPERVDDDENDECSLTGEYIDFEADPESKSSGCAMLPNSSNEGTGADFEVKEILLTEDGTPIVVKEILTNADSPMMISQENAVNQDVGVMRAWKHQESVNDASELENANNPTLAIMSTLLVSLGKNKENEAIRKKLEEKLAAKHVTVEALGEAATQANESIREIVSQLHSKTDLLEKEKVRRERLEALLSERELVIVAVADAIAKQESIMKILEKDLEEIDLIDMEAFHMNDSEILQVPLSNSRSQFIQHGYGPNHCNDCEEKDKAIRDLEVKLEDSRATQVTLAEELTNVRSLVSETENDHKQQIKEMRDLVKKSNENVDRMEIKVKLMLNNSNEVVEALRSKIVNTQERTHDFAGELSHQLDLLRYKEELLGDELDHRRRETDHIEEALAHIKQITSDINVNLQNSETTRSSTQASFEYDDDDNPQLTVIDTQILTDTHEQLSSLHEFEEDLKTHLFKFESDNEVLDEGFGMRRGDRKSLRKLREELALFLGKSRASLHQLEDKVSDYMGSIGEERYARIKELETQLRDKEKMIKLMEKQSAYQEQTLKNLRTDKRKKGRPGLFTR